jgi:hypothetical protein
MNTNTSISHWNQMLTRLSLIRMNMALPDPKQLETSTTNDHSTMVLNDKKLTSYFIISEKDRTLFIPEARFWNTKFLQIWWRCLYGYWIESHSFCMILHIHNVSMLFIEENTFDALTEQQPHLFKSKQRLCCFII